MVSGRATIASLAASLENGQSLSQRIQFTKTFANLVNRLVSLDNFFDEFGEFLLNLIL